MPRLSVILVLLAFSVLAPLTLVVLVLDLVGRALRWPSTALASALRSTADCLRRKRDKTDGQ